MMARDTMRHMNRDTVHLVTLSGGAGSWAAACRVRERYPDERIVALFADTSMEDEDLYRFLPEAAASVGAELVRIADGRTPWDVFFDERFLGNSRIDPCSKILKRQLLDRWRRDNLDAANTVVYIGIDWTEIDRLERFREALAGWRVEAPMCEPPYLTKRDMTNAMVAVGLRPPRLYAMGFVHNNCGGFCVKAGQSHFANLLRVMPERYAFHEQKEQDIRALLGDVSILKDRTGGGPRRPLTLRAFRERIERGASYDLFEIGGCGCVVGLGSDEAEPHSSTNV